ncbi:MAG: nucleoside 2-deoxyribosyltransferase [Methanosarcinaceae archaeon]|nr:nucleoside 2-deoxyribosyltransferase [Methanosarcinaceae archaeon]
MTQIYIAGPLFSEAERSFNIKLKNELEILFPTISLFLPQEDAEDKSDTRDMNEVEKIFNKCFSGLKSSDIVIAVLDGADPDSGTCWECGYAYANGIPIFAIRTDFRISTQNEIVNLMLQESCISISSTIAELKDELLKYKNSKE